MPRWPSGSASRNARAQDFHETFLQRHPSGHVGGIAQFRLDQLAWPVGQAVQAMKLLPGGVDRLRVGNTWAVQRTTAVRGCMGSPLNAEPPTHIW